MSMIDCGLFFEKKIITASIKTQKTNCEEEML
jgi:hypothetical protein